MRLATAPLLPGFAIGASIAIGGAQGEFVYGIEIANTGLRGELFAASAAGLGGYIAANFKQHYQLGLRLHDSLFFTPRSIAARSRARTTACSISVREGCTRNATGRSPGGFGFT